MRRTAPRNKYQAEASMPAVSAESRVIMALRGLMGRSAVMA